MPLAAGTRIGRIRIDALLGTGGMGEVYRGWDEKLERAVALKVVHADKRGSGAMRNRFLREARVLSQLDHPHICRLYDVLEREESDYLVLELVEGTTLRAHVEQGLSRADAVAIALQVARVLAVTHARGIVHRDLKPDNIMLTPAGEVKVLDFGLARSVGGDAVPVLATAEDFAGDDLEKTAILAGRGSATTERDPTHTVAGSLVGTLHYMSPEQARGLPPSETTDIYSLGIVLYEMLRGGRSPYGTNANVNELLVRVRGAEVEPFDCGDRALNALLKRMLALYPTDRPSAADVSRELARIAERPARVRRRVTGAALALAIVLAIAAAVVASRHFTATRPLFEGREGGRLAILPFRNETHDASLRWIELGLPDLVAQGIRRARGLDVVPSDTVTRAMRDLHLRTNAELTGTQRRALLEAMSADVLIAPTVVSDDGAYTIRYTAATRDRVESTRETSSTVLVEAAKQMSIDLVQRIDPASAAPVRARYSLDNIANLLYAMGTQELHTRGPKIAAHYFTVCLDRDRDFIAAQMQLAACLHTMGDDAQSDALLAEALARAKARNDREQYTNGLVARGVFALENGHYALAEQVSQEALASARALGDRDLLARAYLDLGHTALHTGRLDRAKSFYETALRIAVARHDIGQQAQIYNALGNVASSGGNTPEAHVLFAKGLALAERINDRLREVTLIGNLALVEGDAGHFARAEALTRRQLALTRELGDAGTEMIALTNLGLWLWAQGKEQDAVVFTEQAAAVAARAGNPRVEALILSNLATANVKLGDLDAAARHNDAALAKAAPLDDPEIDRDVQLGLAYALIREGKLDDARRAIDRGERWQKNTRSLLMRARLLYARGDYAAAYELATRAKQRHDGWLLQYEQMLQAFAESARTHQPSTVAFESPLRARVSSGVSPPAPPLPPDRTARSAS
ncbi:MAG: serine/threonine protein kinase [Acidobacteria bacterium]|nr:serine/threonine protein kinase [Acidobacteriota bacterium]MBV9476109.1 serine/threonine protein kinase [Acidobacteriota bacterium]